MKKEEAKKLHHKDEVVLKKTFDGYERTLQVCGEPKINGKFILIDLLDTNGSLVKEVSHKFLK